MKKYLWFPIISTISILLTCYMIALGYNAVTIFLTSIGLGAILGVITGLMGYEA